MKTEVLSSKKATQLQISSIITLVLLLISFLWLFYKIYAYQEIRAKATSLEVIYNGIYIGNFLKFILLISFAILLFLALKHNVKFKLLAYLTLIFGIFSFLFIFFDFAALHDIVHDYLTGVTSCVGEWKGLYIGLFINLIFYIIGFITIIKIKREVKTSPENRKSIIDETIFEVIQFVGIVCSTIGLGFILFLYLVLSNNDFIINNSTARLILSFCLVIFLPYISIILYWIIKLLREKELSPYDEKQKQDLAMSGLITWFLSIPLISVFFMINHGRIGQISEVAYFPFYLFATLLIFSISVLYNFKKS